MPTVADVVALLEELAPARLAAEWDNVGLLLGDRRAAVERVMTCLTVTPETAAEAINERVGLIVAHHPFPFKAARRFTADTVAGRMLLDLAAARVAIFSAHTAFDSAAKGINQQLAEGLGLNSLEPLVADGDDASIGTGRVGSIGGSLSELASRCAKFLGIDQVQIVGSPDQTLRRVAIACGSAGELVEAALRAGCDCFVTGEARFHTCLEAQAAGMAMILTGHYASERFGVESLARTLSSKFTDVQCWASRQERDPVRRL